MVFPVQRWETRVIHLNLGGPSPSKPSGPSPKAPEADPSAREGASDQKPIFSESYLKEEFPNHYPVKPDKPPAPQHPATQLQTFMNKLGQEGWEFVGVFPIGQLTMVFFRRPLPPDADVSTPAPSISATEQGVPSSPSTVQPTPVTSASSSQDAVLMQILQRLEALEGSQRRSPSPSPVPLNEPLILSAQQRQELASIPYLSTAEAASALGLRSPASLLNFGARHGYPLGLVKPSGQGLVAVFCGTQSRPSGGKAVRLWQVLPETALPSS